MNHGKLRRLGFFTAFFMILLSFQNCSKITPQQMSDVLSKNEGQVPKGQDDGGIKSDPVLEQPDADDEPRDVAENDDDDSQEPSTNPDDPAIPGHEGCTSHDREWFKNYCENIKNLATVTDTKVENHRGKRRYGITNLDLVSNLRGRHLFKGLNPDSHIDQINKVKGSLVLCGVSVGNMSEGAGRVVIVNGHIDHVLSHRGHIRLIDSSIGTIENHRGRVLEK